MINNENISVIGDTVRIKEIFTSIQGEGPYIGAKQLFIRFCNCNLKCHYCDTEFLGDSTEYSQLSLYNSIKQFDLKSLNSVSLTGGEPLLSSDFLRNFLPLLKQLNLKVYLETNATLVDEFKKIKDYVDVVAADLKLESATGNINTFNAHEQFFDLCADKEVFAKIVFDENITDEEIMNCINIAKKYGLLLILQPKMIKNSMSVNSVFAVSIMDKFLKHYSNVRLIPQVHKFLAVR